MPIGELQLSTIQLRLLRRAGCRTVDDVVRSWPARYPTRERHRASSDWRPLRKTAAPHSWDPPRAAVIQATHSEHRSGAEYEQSTDANSGTGSHPFSQDVLEWQDRPANCCTTPLLLVRRLCTQAAAGLALCAARVSAAPAGRPSGLCSPRIPETPGDHPRAPFSHRAPDCERP